MIRLGPILALGVAGCASSETGVLELAFELASVPLPEALPPGWSMAAFTSWASASGEVTAEPPEDSGMVSAYDVPEASWSGTLCATFEGEVDPRAGLSEEAEHDEADHEEDTGTEPCDVELMSMEGMWMASFTAADVGLPSLGGLRSATVQVEVEGDVVPVLAGSLVIGAEGGEEPEEEAGGHVH